MTTALLVLGAGGHGRVVADAAASCGYDNIAFLDDSFPEIVRSGPFPVIGKLAEIADFLAEWPSAIVGIGSNVTRLELFERLGDLGFQRPAIIHPAATLSRHAQIAEGVFAAAGVVVNIGATIGKAAILNTGATVDHDCLIGAGVHISPGAHLGGNVVVGDRSWIGVGASVRHGTRIGTDAIVGAGAAVVDDVPDALTYAGVPARRLLKKR